MNPLLVTGVVGGYFILLTLIAYFTSQKADSKTFFTANRQSPWFLVAFGMIGASMSGVTFISVPGWVGSIQFTYFQMVLGYLVGYWVIATILMPLYYKLNLVSIYTYLDSRFGFWSYKSGAFFFILSRIVGSSFRLFLVASVLQIALFDSWGVPFEITVAITIILIWIYTFRGGIKTIVFTDTLQTLFMLTAVVITIKIVSSDLGLNFGEMVSSIRESSYSKVFEWGWAGSQNFFKQFFSGAFIAIVMTGLDQDMMQKNLTCRTLKDAQKNMFWFCIILVLANILFLSLGALLYIYSNAKGIQIPAKTDDLYPLLAMNHFSTFTGIVFLLGITAAAYSSADSALTSLTTSFCVDFLNFKESDNNKLTRIIVHLSFSFLLFIAIIIFKHINNEAVISAVFTAAGYTYGPLLGLFAFGLFTPYNPKDKFVPLVCILSPILAYILNLNSKTLLMGYEFGFEILIVNGMITFLGLLILSNRPFKRVFRSNSQI